MTRMTRSSPILAPPTRLGVAAWVIALALASTALIMTGTRASQASAAARQAESELHRARAITDELTRLKSSAPSWMSARREETGLAPRVTAVLASVGLPAVTMTSFSVQREANLGGKELGAARERATCVLAGLTLPQLGQVLAAWREREPQWTPTTLDLGPMTERAPQAGGDIPLRVVLTLESVYVEDRNAPVQPAPQSPG